MSVDCKQNNNPLEMQNECSDNDTQYTIEFIRDVCQRFSEVMSEETLVRDVWDQGIAYVIHQFIDPKNDERYFISFTPEGYVIGFSQDYEEVVEASEESVIIEIDRNDTPKTWDQEWSTFPYRHTTTLQ